MAPQSWGTPRVVEAVGDAPCAPPRDAPCRAVISEATRAQLQGKAGKLLSQSAFPLLLGSRGCSDRLPPEKALTEEAAASAIRCSGISQKMLLPLP